MNKDGADSIPIKFKMTAIDDKAIHLTLDNENNDDNGVIVVNRVSGTNNDDSNNLGSELQTSLNKLQEKDMGSLLSQAEALSERSDSLPPTKLTFSTNKASRALLLTMENKLLSLLETTDSSGDTTISLLEASQELMVSILNPMNAIQSLQESFKGLHDKARGLTSTVKVLTSLVLKLGKRCPFAP